MEKALRSGPTSSGFVPEVARGTLVGREQIFCLRLQGASTVPAALGMTFLPLPNPTLTQVPLRGVCARPMPIGRLRVWLRNFPTSQGGFRRTKGRDEKEAVVIRLGDASAREPFLDHRMSFFKEHRPSPRNASRRNAVVSFAVSDPYLHIHCRIRQSDVRNNRVLIKWEWLGLRLRDPR